MSLNVPVIPRALANLLVILLAVLLVQLFLVRIPTYLLSRTPPAPEVAPLAAPDWGTHVEGVRPHHSRGAGSSAVRDGVPAAPDRD